MSLEPFTTVAAHRELGKIGRCEVMQRQLLSSILERSSGSPVANALAVSGRETFEDFLKLEPRDYGFYKPFVDSVLGGDRNAFGSAPITAMGETSGSMGQPKLIPFTDESLDLYARFTRCIFLFHLWQGQTYLPRRTKWLLVAASSAVREEAGLPIGFVSGLMYKRSSAKRGKYILPSPEIGAIADWDERVQRSAAEAIGEQVGSCFGVPAYITRLFKEASAQVGGRPLCEVWPKLNKIYYSGTSIDGQKAEMEQLVGRSLSVRSMYSATEAVMGAELDKGANGQMRFFPDMAVFTFRPENGGHAAPLVPMWQLQQGIRYDVFVTTVSGLMQYKIGDLIEVTHKNPMLFRIAGRSGDEINLATEKLSSRQAELVMQTTADALGVSASRFVVVPDPLAACRHLWVLEVNGSKTADCSLAASQIDQALAKINPSYAALRAGDSVLQRPRVVVLPFGAFDSYIAAGLASHGQFKFRHVHADCGKMLEKPGLETIGAHLQ